MFIVYKRPFPELITDSGALLKNGPVLVYNEQPVGLQLLNMMCAALHMAWL